METNQTNNLVQNSYSSNDPNQNTRKTLYLVSFIFLIIGTVLGALVSLSVLITGFSATLIDWSTIIDETNPELVDAEIAVFKGIIIFTGLICLALTIYSIVATIFCHRYYLEVGTKKEKAHLAFGICVLLFTPTYSVPGILLIVASSLKKPPPLAE